MTADNRPEAFGVFKPVGHVVVAFPGVDDMQGAADALTQEGIASGDIVRFTPEQMVAQADKDIAGASPLASIGQELNLVKAHRDLAQQGYAFLVVKTDKDEAARHAVELARRFHAARAQYYGRFVIEELIEPGDGETQVAESPDRGLDPQTATGEEGDAGKTGR